MNNQLAVSDDFQRSMIDLEQTNQMCHALMNTPHYAKLGEVGIYTIVQRARSIGINPMEALNGGMYFLKGKVELSAATMNCMIRAKGHSIIKDDRSTREICILRGKRCDNGDTWTASFSIQEAQTAGIYKDVWVKYPEDMLFNRALSRLARQLFPDVIKGCYVEGEIREAVAAEQDPVRAIEAPKTEVISSDQAVELSSLLKKCSPEFQEEIRIFCHRTRISESLDGLPMSLFDRLQKAIYKKIDEMKVCDTEVVAVEEIEVEVEVIEEPQVALEA